MSTTTPYPQPKCWCDKKQVPCEYANIHGRCKYTGCQRRDLETVTYEMKGLFIKGMDMPERCIDCPFLDNNDNCILQPNEQGAYTWEALRKLCPLENISLDLPKGEWIKATGFAPPEFTGRYVCSNCGHYALMDVPYGSRQKLSHFCPNCRADMSGGAK